LARSLLPAIAGALWLWCGSVAAQALLWSDGLRPGPQAGEAVALLTAAASHGLDPEDYAATALREAVDAASRGTDSSPEAAARLDTALTAAVERYLSDLHGGRVDPKTVHQRFIESTREPFDAAAQLRAALAAGRLTQAADAAAPRIPLYERLRGALARYRELGDHPAWQLALAPLPPGPKGGRPRLEPGQPYASLGLLAQRLQALGDLGADATLPPRYEGPLVDAVRSFQQRHGLGADGVIGAATKAQLDVAPPARLRQIELTMERLRWTPLMAGPRMLVINLPEFVLRAYEVSGEQVTVRQEMKVIVGKALATQTPVFDEDMRFIEFSPYWNVPPSIARGELVPRLRRDPGHFVREGYEFVGPGGQVDTTLSAARLDAVLAGGWRIRQRPGARNALGDIKFIFPNNDNIYLHHTPSVGLFERERRDFSHGCIRVEQPVALALFVLEPMPAWTEERIREAMSKGQSSTLRLAEPLRVLITYGTVFVKDDRVHFFDDIYRYDRLLDAALRQRKRG
jgi:L,D-transpeptidase YcbB